MIKRTLKEIERMSNGSGLKNNYDETVINGVSIDTRKINPGQLFVPIKGERFNGHNFIESAMENGATAALWNKDEEVPNVDFPFILVDDTLEALQQLSKSYLSQLNTKVIGITGSNGKTSTKDILSAILKTKYKTQKTLGNLNNHLGVPLTLLDLEEDTEMAVIEMGMSNTGQIELLTKLAPPHVSIITSISDVHINELYTREAIVDAKLEILEGLRPNGLFICNGDEPILNKKLESIRENINMVTFGQNPNNLYRPEIKSIEDTGITFGLIEPNGEDHTFFLPMIGVHQAYNATAAILASRHFNVPWDLIQDGFDNIEATGMRNELIDTGKFTILNDAYKSNIDSVLAAFETLYSLKKYSQKIVVLGDMLGTGDNEVQNHVVIGEKIDPSQVDYLLTIGPLAKIIAEAAKPRFPEGRVLSFMGNSELERKLQEVMIDNSIVMFKASRDVHLEEVVLTLSQSN